VKERERREARREGASGGTGGRALVRVSGRTPAVPRTAQEACPSSESLLSSSGPCTGKFASAVGTEPFAEVAGLEKEVVLEHWWPGPWWPSDPSLAA